MLIEWAKTDPQTLTPHDPSLEAGIDTHRHIGTKLPGLAFSRPKNKFGHFKNLVGFEMFENLLSSWPFYKSI